MLTISDIKHFSLLTAGLALIVATLTAILAAHLRKNARTPQPTQRILQKIARVLTSPWVLVIIGTIAYSTLSLFRHWRLESHAFDLGIFTQVIYNYATGPRLFNTIRGLNILSDHFHPFLILLTPFFWISPRAETLLIIQSFFVSLAAYPVYKLSHLLLKNRFLAWALAFAFIAAPGLQTALLFDFHEILFAPTLLLFLAYAAFTKKWRAYWLVFALTLTVKENAPIYLAAWSLYFMLRTRHWKIGGSGIAIAALYFVIIMKIIMPGLSGNATTEFNYYDFPQFGKTPLEAATTALTHPIYTWDIFNAPKTKVLTRHILLTGFAYLPWISPLAWIAAFPMLIEQFLFNVPAHWTLQFHYAAAITFALFLGTLDILIFFQILIKRYFPKAAQHITHTLFFTAALIFITNTILITQRAELPLTKLFQTQTYTINKNIRDTRALLKTIPPQASVAAAHALVPHLAARRDIIAWPPNLPLETLYNLHADYVILSLHGSLWPQTNIYEQLDLMETFINNPNYGLVDYASGTLLFKRKAPMNVEKLWQFREETKNIK